MFAPLEVFCCYAREDRALLKSLRSHLMPLQRAGQLTIWSDADLSAGEEWEKVLHRHLESADMILLLISADFMDSDYCYSTEMKRAIERHKQGSARVIPVLLRPTFWQPAPFANLAMLPADRKPVTDWPTQDSAFHHITEQINQLVPVLQVQRALREAKAHYTGKRYAEALALYEQLLGVEPANGTALFGKASMLYFLEETDRCLEAFDQAEQLAPDAGSADDYWWQACALRQHKRLSVALIVYDKALLKLSNDLLGAIRRLDIYEAQADILIELQEYDRALATLELLRRLTTDNTRYSTRAGELLFRLRRFEQALDLYTRASEQEPHISSHHEQRGLILLEMKRYEEALAAYHRALSIAPRADLYAQAGRIYLLLARPGDALEMYDAAIKLSSEPNPYHYASKGQAFLMREEYEEALACYQQAIKLSAPDTDPQFYHELGALHERLARRAYEQEEERRRVWRPAPQPERFLIAVLDPARVTLRKTVDAHSKGILDIAFSPDGTLLASASEDHSIKLWEIPFGRKGRALRGHTNIVRSVAFSPDGTLLASASDDGTIRLWNIPSGDVADVLTEHIFAVLSIAFSSDGTLLASGNADGSIQLREISSGRELHSLSGHTTSVRSLALSPNGRFLASTDSTFIKLWEIPSGRLLSTLPDTGNYIFNLAFSPNSKLLASANGTSIMLWKIPSGNLMRTFDGHTDGVLSIAFSPRGHLLASGSADKTIKLWPVFPVFPYEFERHTLEGHTDSVTNVAFRPDGTLLASGCIDGTIRLWGRAL